MGRFISISFLVLLSASVCSAADLAVDQKSISAPVASYDIRFMSMGAPADSVVLRVSVGYTPGRCCGTPFIIVEEMKWPLLAMVLDFELDPTDPDSAFKLVHERLWKTGTRLGIRPSDLPLGYRPQPFEFVKWISPFEFSVSSSGDNFVIRRVSAGNYEVTRGDVE